MSSIKELLAEYNSLADKPLASWKQSREKLQQRVDDLKKSKPPEKKLNSVFREKPTQPEDPAAVKDFPVDGEKIGVFLQRLLLANAYTTSELVAYGKEFYPTSKVSASDIGWHRAFLKRSGTPSKLVRLKKDGTRYIVEKA